MHMLHIYFPIINDYLFLWFFCGVFCVFFNKIYFFKLCMFLLEFSNKNVISWKIWMLLLFFEYCQHYIVIERKLFIILRLTEIKHDHISHNTSHMWGEYYSCLKEIALSMDYAYMCIPHHYFYYQTLICNRFWWRFMVTKWNGKKKYTAD